jgi:dihydrolipoamide dehydrogenase
MITGKMPEETEVLVIGGGAGGYAAAFRAADLGLDVTLVNAEERPGGVCLFRGCIPVKTLLYSAEIIKAAGAMDTRGIHFSEPEIDCQKLRKNQNEVINQLASNLEYLAQKRGVRLIRGRARFETSREVSLSEPESVRIRFRHVILATGSLPNHLPGMSFEQGSRIMDASAALQIEEIPDSLLIVGGGYIGLEFGSIYACLGTRVTLVETMDRLMAGTDQDLLKPLNSKLHNLFEEIHTNTKVTSLKETAAGVEAAFENESDLRTFDKALIAIGRHADTRGLGLENTGLELDDKGYVIVDKQQRTADSHIFAVGDVVGGTQLAHKTFCEGRVAAEVIAGRPSVFAARPLPKVVFTDPQIAWCGLTESAAEMAGRKVKVIRVPWSACGRAVCMGAAEGLTKMILEPEGGHILGVGIVGRNAGELIAEGVLAVKLGAKAEDVALTPHPHPTLSESLAEAAGTFLGTAVNTLPFQ